jgi:hypothetical protein
MAMPEQDLDDADVGPVLEKMRREAMTENVDGDAFVETRRQHR